MSQSSQILSVREKIGYSLGDAAANFVFQTMLVFQLSFYTDTFGLTASAAGTLFLVVRFWDAIFDPIMGVVADRTKTRWGKFRPWILWTAVPFGVVGVLAFTTPHFGYHGKLIYAYATYILLMMVYSANNLPYSALSGVMTSDGIERTSLSSYRFVSAMIAAFAIQGLAMPMVKLLGGGSDARGYQLTMGLFSILGVIFFIITFLSTRERIQPAPDQKTSIKQDFTDLSKNRAWFAIFALTILYFIALSLRGGVMVYYFKYYLHKPDLFSYYNVTGLGATIIGIFLSKPLVTRFGKPATFVGGLILTSVFMAPLLWVPATGVVTAFVLQGLAWFCYGPTVPLLWSMMADVADYSEWKNRRRATGVIFSAIVFGLKAGLGFGGAIGGWLLASYGYNANAEQSETALTGIRLCASVFPVIPFLLGAACLSFYPINSRMNRQIQDELDERRRVVAGTA